MTEPPTTPTTTPATTPPDSAQACVEPTRPAMTRMRFLSQVWKLAGPYWRCERKAKVRGATLLLLLLTMGQVALTVWGNYWHGALYDALEQKSVRGVLIQVAVFVVMMVCSLLVTAAHLMVKRWIQIDWRAWLTERLVGSWLGEARHYRLLYAQGDHDNPDQRIAEDIRIATESAIGLAHSLTYCVLTLGLFIDILWSVSGAMDVPGTQVHIPGYMVPLAFLYAILGSAFGWAFGRPLVRTTNSLQTAEATFRFGLSRVREHTEAIAIMRGDALERAGSTLRFGRIVRDWNAQSLAFLGLVSFGTVYGGILPVLPILMAAPQYIAGAMTLGMLMQAAQAFERLTASLSWPVDSIGEIARCRASAERVLSLYEDMEQMDENAGNPCGPTIGLERGDSGRLVAEDLCIAESTGRVLIEGLNLDIRRGERLLITGDPAVTGALFKVVGGIWPWGTGKVRLPGNGDMMLLSQRPFLPEVTLREAICYPHAPRDYPDADVRRALETVGLSRLASRLDERDTWEQNLPQRVQQQLGFVRVLLQRPPWIFLEEATDAFDPEGERRILEILQRELPDSTLINVSFHSGLEDLHHRKVTLARSPEARVLFGERRKVNGGQPA